MYYPFHISHKLLEGEDDPLGKIISDPTVDIVLLLIQFRNLVKVSSGVANEMYLLLIVVT